MDVCNCCDGSSPEVVRTVNVTTNSIDANNALTLTLGTVAAATDPLTVAIQIVDEDAAAVAASGLIHWWLVDTNNKAGAKSVVTPTLPGAVEDENPTDATGLLNLVIQNSGAAHTWYVVAELLGILYISGPITLGT